MSYVSVPALLLHALCQLVYHITVDHFPQQNLLCYRSLDLSCITSVRSENQLSEYLMVAINISFLSESQHFCMKTSDDLYLAKGKAGIKFIAKFQVYNRDDFVIDKYARTFDTVWLF